MNTNEISKIEKWIVANVTAGVVPSDEGNSYGFIYNLIQLLRKTGKSYDYLPEQTEELRSLGVKVYDD